MENDLNIVVSAIKDALQKSKGKKTSVEVAIQGTSLDQVQTIKVFLDHIAIAVHKNGEDLMLYEKEIEIIDNGNNKWTLHIVINLPKQLPITQSALTNMQRVENIGNKIISTVKDGYHPDKNGIFSGLDVFYVSRFPLEILPESYIKSPQTRAGIYELLENYFTQNPVTLNKKTTRRLELCRIYICQNLKRVFISYKLLR